MVCPCEVNVTSFYTQYHNHCLPCLCKEANHFHSKKSFWQRKGTGWLTAELSSVCMQNLIFKKVCWLSSFPKVMIDGKLGPGFQSETWHHRKSPGFMLHHKPRLGPGFLWVWPKFMNYFDEPDCLPFRFQPVFTLTGAKFQAIRGHVAFQVENHQNWSYFPLNVFALSERTYI